MRALINEIRERLTQLENNASMASDLAVSRAFSGLELPDIIRDVVDFLMPCLTPYQFSIYVYMLRHSILSEGTPFVRVSRRGLQTVIKSASGQSNDASYKKMQETLEALEQLGAISRQGEPNRDGTPYRILLPEEIVVCQELREASRQKTSPAQLSEAEVDFYNVRGNRLKIFERDAFKCRYCNKQLTRFTATLDHVHPISEGGDNTQANLVTACLDCNSRKNSRPLGDFLVEKITLSKE